METDNPVLVEWERQGCIACRQRWMDGNRLPPIAEHVQTRDTLFCCGRCLTYWELGQQYPEVLTRDQVREKYNITEEMGQTK